MKHYNSITDEAAVKKQNPILPILLFGTVCRSRTTGC